MEYLHFALNLLVGLAIGLLGGLFGIGGGIIAIPVLGLLYDMDQQIAQGTTLVMVVPNVMLSIWRYNQFNPIDRRMATALVTGGVVFALIGSTVAVNLHAERMRWAFIVFLVLLALFSLWRAYAQRNAVASAQPRYGLRAMTALGSFGGLLGGIFGVGGGVVATPILTSVFGLTQVVAQGLALALAMPSISVALVVYALHGEVDWSVGIALMLGGLASISWGIRLAHVLPERAMRTSFCGFMLLCALLLLLKV